MNYETAAIRRFLQERFSDEELNHLCFDYFPDVNNNFTAGMLKGQKVQLLLDQCRKQGRWPDLLAALQRERPDFDIVAFSPPPQTTAVPQPRRPIQRNLRQIFISYAHQDAKFSRRLAADLQKRGWPVWIAPDSIQPGEKWVEAINRGLEERGIFLLVLTPDAVNSRWVQSETNLAIQWEHQNKLRFIPLRMQSNDVPNTPALWQSYQQIPFDKTYRVGLQALLNELQPKPTKPPSRKSMQPSPNRSRPAPAIETPKARPSSPLSSNSWTSLIEAVPVWGWVVLAIAIIGFSIWGLGQLVGDDSGGTTPVAEETTVGGEEMASLIQTRTPKPDPAPTKTTTLPPTEPPPTNTPTFTPPPTTIPTVTYTPTPTLDPNLVPLKAALHNAWTRPADGMVMVYVPGGTFMMGSDNSDENADNDEKPQHKVTLDSFWIDRTEVTNAQFANFLNENGNLEDGGVTWLDLDDEDALIEKVGSAFQPKSGFANHPVIEVSWYGSDAFCKWVGGQLPTEAQWEYAARGDDGRIYPWGNQSPTCELAQFGDCSSRTVPVGSFSPAGDSWVDAADMAGNVWEWIADWYDGDYYETSPEENPIGPESGSSKVLRGGSWGLYQLNLRAAYRVNFTPVNRGVIVGFRCAASPGN